MITAKVNIAAPLAAYIGVNRPKGSVNWANVDERTHPVQSCSLTWSWGSEPSEANIVYLDSNPVNVGSAIKLTVGPYFFAGICEADSPLVSSKGNTRELTFKDFRKWLAWDKVYASFNRLDDMLIGGVRRKRYQSILPWNNFQRKRTWRNAPYTCAEILDLVLHGPGIGTPWTMARISKVGDDYVVQDGYHSAMNYPIYDLDFEKGKSLGELMLDIGEATGLVFTLIPTATNLFRIVWAQKGVDGAELESEIVDGVEVGDLEGTDDRRISTELSGNPTRLRVLGDRNLYQCHDIELVPDWNRNWEAFYDENLLADYIYRAESSYQSVDPPQNIIGRQRALSDALAMTVWEFDDFVAAHGGTAGDFLDNHRIGGRCRNDVPAAWYIKYLLFRAFRLPDGFSFWNTYGPANGGLITNDCIDVQDKLLTAVWHDPITGLTSWDTDPLGSGESGNAYVIVKGYQVGKDTFDKVRPDRFDLNEWNSAQDIWQKVDVHVQNNFDEQGPTILFDEPVIRSSNLVIDASCDAAVNFNGLKFVNSAPTFEVPPVKATLVFAAENFTWYQTLVIDNPSVPPQDPINYLQIHDETVQMSGLCGEFIVIPPVANGLPGQCSAEIYYADGKSVRTKAAEYANSLLRRQQTHSGGSFVKQFNNGDTAYQLHGKMDRVTIDHSPSGSTVRVYRTNERARDYYTPEQDLDRMTRMASLLSGEAQLRNDSQLHLKIAAAARTSPVAYKMLADGINGVAGHARSAVWTDVQAGTAPTGRIGVGSVFLKSPTATDKRPVAGKYSTPGTHTTFAGFAVTDGNMIYAGHGGRIVLQTTGNAFGQVQCPVNKNDAVKIVPGQSYLSTSGSGDVVGKVMHDVTGSGVKIAEIQIGAAAAVSTYFPFKIYLSPSPSDEQLLTIGPEGAEVTRSVWDSDYAWRSFRVRAGSVGDNVVELFTDGTNDNPDSSEVPEYLAYDGINPDGRDFLAPASGVFYVWVDCTDGTNLDLTECSIEIGATAPDTANYPWKYIKVGTITCVSATKIATIRQKVRADIPVTKGCIDDEPDVDIPI